jgi:hypothetical protein
MRMETVQEATAAVDCVLLSGQLCGVQQQLASLFKSI